MRKSNVILLLFILAMAIGWGIVYWLFFAENVVGG